jgi:hypothetical protein
MDTVYFYVSIIYGHDSIAIDERTIEGRLSIII